MVRSFPTGESPLTNPFRSQLFTFAFIVTTIAIVSFLCGKKKRKRPSSLNNQTRTTTADENTDLLVTSTNDQAKHATHINVEDKKNDIIPPPESTVKVENKELPPPPRLASLRASSCHIGSSSNASQGAKLTSSLSMRLTGGLKGLRKGSKRYDNNKDKKPENDKLTREDSVWKKTIILGEKCRIPDEDEDDIILDENGQRITTFHRKQSCSSLSLSRQSSTASRI